MSKVDFSQFKVRCSAISTVLSDSKDNPCLTEKQTKELAELRDKQQGKPLTEAQGKRLAELEVKESNGSKVVLSTTCVQYLMDEYAWATEKMVRVTKELLDVPHMQKGTIVEPDSLNLLRIVDGIEYKANINDDGTRTRVYNDYLSGEVDAYLGESIMHASIIIDQKSQWDFPTFLCKIQEPLTLANELQVKGYCDISGATQGIIANCLVNTPEHIIAGQKWKLLNKLNVATEEAPEFKEKWSILERSMYFDHIPHHKRVFKKNVTPMTAFERTALYDRVKVCRQWLNEFHETYQKINL